MHQQMDSGPRQRHLSVKKKQKQLELAVKTVQEKNRRPWSFCFRRISFKRRRVPEAGLPKRPKLLSGHRQGHGKLQFQFAAKAFTWSDIFHRLLQK